MKTKFKLIKDKLEVFLKLRHPLIPPSRYDVINIGNNLEIANEFFEYFKAYGQLFPESNVLEIGSGFGRMAIPLTNYLNEKGSYDGIEIMSDGVNWCKNQFSKRFSNFSFHKLDVYNDRYNPGGTLNAMEYKFPFNDNSFDFIFLTSVFTHMYLVEIKNYVKEVTRLLKPGGRCLATYYLLTEKSKDFIKAKRANIILFMNLEILELRMKKTLCFKLLLMKWKL